MQIIHVNATYIFVALHFTNISDTDVVSADDALGTLQSLAQDDGTLPFQVDISNGMMAAPVLVSSNRGRQIACNATCNQCPSPNSNLSDGAVAGIAVGLFFGGFLFALVFACGLFICIKCLKGRESLEVSSVKYKKQDDELDG
jgi:hypothetical protein